MIHSSQLNPGNRSFYVRKDNALDSENTNRIRRTQSNVALRPQNLNLDKLHGNVINQNHIDDNASLVEPDNIQIEVPRDDERGGSNVQQNNNITKVFDPVVRSGATEPSFAQRHPTLTKLFAGFVAVLAWPIIFAVNVVVTPFLMGAAFFSQACGSGDLAKDIGNSTIAKGLWGDLADDIAENKMASWKMGLMAFFPYFGPEIPSLFAALGVYTSIRDFLLFQPLPVSNEDIRKPEPSEIKGVRAALPSDHVKPKNLSTRAMDAFHDEQGKMIGYVDKENGVYDAEGNPFTGIAPALDGKGMAAYGISDGRGKANQLDIITDSGLLWISQGRTGDCYALTTMYGLLKQPAINKWFADNAWFNRDGSLVMNFPRTKEVEKSLGDRWQMMGPKGYSISTGKNAAGEAVINVTVSKEKLNDILKLKQRDEGDKGGGRRAYSHSVFVLAMEHFIGNMARAPEGDLNESFEAHSSKLVPRDIQHDGVAALFGCKSEQCDSITTDQIKQWKTGKKCLADCNDNPTPGFIYCSTGGHAYSLHDIILDETGNVKEVKMVNPWNTSNLIETWLAEKFMAATWYEISQAPR